MDADGSVIPYVNCRAPAAAAISAQVTGRPTQPSRSATDRRRPSTTGEDMMSTAVPSRACASGCSAR